MKHIFFYQTNIGEIGIAENKGAITNLFIKNEHIPQEVVVKETAVLKEAGKQLMEYFAGKRKSFTLPLAPEGTEFQKKVWKALQEIPCGETRSYKDVARSIGQPKASRAIGMANNKNPMLILIPCHRVIGANGNLVGYAAGLQVKEYLLKLEK
ncbi:MULTISPECIES: methylated-DNA--[protein]-cysteine S-methyltransferase [Pelosinus]|jgi:methylated-DNA-[protein]-cysteine S-methyltransferase|uniref:Methylated-DNA--protein-cysteine methyltransferase n=1 Tax=Pelosinus fermentans B4 TaxID=1149862 RepID=I8RBK2_9FIRM|nr:MULTISPECIES: methylated-DNA--[protein]-cysteine S-methyltransferase [Pelosinus]EIW16398.1 methylated-DNA/protein-cysteine methyltransferase [Pelosinus fermentans B4]EIW22621.1 methylated-DNA/protein-cysteine methyltransferase [Pelosinus fermentans A11]OAM95705.1 Methylated-DNA--protein-cysteine methyltransferase [Pelosinus fermentans DSM 17108]SDR31809.1 methylated-DNA-[protein]-cysteine S-methyltransferase [Pelosinus fermentans]